MTKRKTNRNPFAVPRLCNAELWIDIGKVNECLARGLWGVALSLLKRIVTEMEQRINESETQYGPYSTF